MALFNDTVTVFKFGGSSLKDESNVQKVSDFIAHLWDVKKGPIVVVVSALGNTTNELNNLAKRISPNPHKRELDVLLTCGERISMSLLAIALQDKGIPAHSFTGSQAAIITSNDPGEAKIIHVKADRILGDLESGNLPIIAGFQGVSVRKEITTLGRGGSDLTAVALGVALGSKEVVLVKDVPGFYRNITMKDLGTVTHIGYGAINALSFLGSEVIQNRALLLAAKYKMKIIIKSIDGGEIMTTITDEISESCSIEAIEEREGFDIGTKKNSPDDVFWSVISEKEYFLTKGAKNFATFGGKNFSANFVSEIHQLVKNEMKIPIISMRFGIDFIDLVMERKLLPKEKKLLFEISKRNTDS